MRLPPSDTNLKHRCALVAVGLAQRPTASAEQASSGMGRRRIVTSGYAAVSLVEMQQPHQPLIHTHRPSWLLVTLH